jgi:hypothetical protein
LNGSLKDEKRLGIELKSHPDSLYTWKISQEPPFKYRVLHKVVVKNIYQIAKGEQDDNKLFFRIYQITAFALQSLAIILFYFFLTQINLKENAWLGTLLFALLPPLLFAYNLPVHTREDTLAYILLILGLLSIVKNNPLFILLLAIVGVLCRETLLLLPFVNLFFNKNQNIYLRLSISAIAFGTFLLIRLYFGLEVYNYWEGLTWNKNNMPQVIGFGYITFGFLWIPFFYFFIKRANNTYNRLIYDSAPSVFVLVVVTTFIGGIFNEIRILYLLFPWVITSGLSFYAQHKLELIEFVKSRKFKLFAGVLAVIQIAITSYAVKVVNQSFTSQYDIPYLTWLVVASLQVYLGIVSLFYSYSKRKRISLT